MLDDALAAPGPWRAHRAHTQELYDNLQRAGSAHQLPGQHHSRPRRRPSGLTIVDHIHSPTAGSGRGGGGGSSDWWSGLKSMMRGSDDEDAGSGTGPAVQGLYMYGGVGCGKTMLMDLFVDTAPPHFKVPAGGRSGRAREGSGRGVLRRG